MIASLTAAQVEQVFGLQDITLSFQRGVPQVKDAAPLINARLLRCWHAGTLTPEAAAYQVRAFLIRQGIALSSIPALITSLTAEGSERDEALMRWEFVSTFPKTHPLVAAAAQSLQLNLDEVWWSILEIE